MIIINSSYFVWRYSRIRITAAAPSPAADTTCLVDPFRQSSWEQSYGGFPRDQEGIGTIQIGMLFKELVNSL